MPCPAQSSDLNPIENLSGDISVFAKLCRRDGVRFPANVART